MTTIPILSRAVLSQPREASLRWRQRRKTPTLSPGAPSPSRAEPRQPRPVTDPYTESGYAPNMDVRGTAKEIAAAGPRIAGNVINLLSDPYANLAGYPSPSPARPPMTSSRRKLGYSPLTPEQRADLYAPFGDQTGNRGGDDHHRPERARRSAARPLQRRPGIAPDEKLAKGAWSRRVAPLACLAPGGVGATIAGGTGQVGGEALASQVADWSSSFSSTVGGKRRGCQGRRDRGECRNASRGCRDWRQDPRRRRLRRTRHRQAVGW